MAGYEGIELTERELLIEINQTISENGKHLEHIKVLLGGIIGTLFSLTTFVNSEYRSPLDTLSGASGL